MGQEREDKSMRDRKETAGFLQAAEAIGGKTGALLLELPERFYAETQEIGLRAGRPVTLVCGRDVLFPDGRGGARAHPVEGSPEISAPELAQTLHRLCGYSVYSYQEELAGEPVYRYTFAKDEDGTLTLTGIRQVGILNESCDAVIDAAEPLEDEAPELEVPERVMISSEDMQYEVDLQQEYEGTTAVDYLMDLLQGAQRVESAASDQVLAGNGARTLTMTMSYTGGEEVVLNIMSRGYLPGIESSYMTFSIGSRQYVLEQSAYTDFTACINTCRAAA